jgi:hypothetical protein
MAKFRQSGHTDSGDFNFRLLTFEFANEVPSETGLPDGIYFRTKNANLGKIWSVLQLNMLVNVMDISSILLSFGIFNGH